MFIVLFIVLVLFAVRQTTYKPIQVVKQHFGGQASSLSVNRLLKQVKLNEEQVLLFYYNNKNNIAYALLEKGLLGYKLLHASGELTVKNDVIPAGLQFGFYNKESGWVGCGVIYDDSVAKIIIDDNNANIINGDDIRLWYLVGTGEIDTDNTKIIDYNGNDIIH